MSAEDNIKDLSQNVINVENISEDKIIKAIKLQNHKNLKQK